MDNNSKQQPPTVQPVTATEVTRSPLPVKPQLAVLAVVMVVLLGSAVGPALLKAFIGSDNRETERIDTLATVPGIGFTQDELQAAFTDISITGHSAYVWDVRAQQALYAENAGEALPLASLTKLMTALVAHELLEPEATVSIDAEAARQDSASGLLVGTTFKRQSLSDLILMASSNDGAYALAATAGAVLREDDGAAAFVAAMNVRADELGLADTRYLNPTGLDISKTEAGAYGSARDVAFLMEHILENEPDILALTTADSAEIVSASGASIEAENTNFYIDNIPGLLGSKTGYTDLAGGNLTVAFDAGLDRPIIVVVLGSTQFGRFTDVMNLVEASQKLIATH